MGLILLPGRFNQQPQQAVAIDWGNPLTKGLISCIDGRTNYDLMAGAPTTNTAAQANGTGGAGPAYASGTYQTFPFNRSSITNKFTYFLFCDHTTAGNSFLFGDVETAGAGYNAGLYTNGSNFLLFVKTGGSGTSVTSTSSANPIKSLRLGGTYDGANMRIFINGVREASTAKTGNVDTGAFALNLNRWNGSSPHSGNAFLRLVFNIVKSDAEMRELSDNPWQVFKAPPRRIWGVAAGGGSDVSVALTGEASTASAGTLVPSIDKELTGSGSTASAGTLAPSTAKALLGESATAAAGTLVATPTFGLTGQSATAAAGDVIQSRTVALAGQSATVEQGQLGIVGDVTVALTGQSMTMGQGNLARQADAAEAFSGGFFEVPHVPRRRSVREERERLGIFPREVKQIALAVARASVVADKTDDQAERQLAARLAQQDIEAKTRYVEFMRQERDRLLSRDIERALRIRQRQYELDEDEREAEMLLM
jgi:hypothetical protein